MNRVVPKQGKPHLRFVHGEWTMSAYFSNDKNWTRIHFAGSIRDVWKNYVRASGEYA